jgi:hypothetical protein
MIRRRVLGSLVALLSSLALGCSDSPPVPDRIEMRVSGWSAIDIEMSRDGSGRFETSQPRPGGRSGSFSLTPWQWQRLRDRLEPYRKQAVPVTDDSAREFIERRCPEGTPFVTDLGAVYVRWIGPDLDRHYLADLGCDPKRHESRNEELLAIVNSLPVPADR